MLFTEKKGMIPVLPIFWLLSIVLFAALMAPFVRRLFFDQYGRWLYILIFSFLTAALLTPVMRIIAVRAGIVDTPGGRKIHSQVTPLLGGVAIVISFILGLLANMILDERDIALVAGGTVVAIVGLVDDWKGIRARYKLLIQVLVVLFLIRSGIILDLFHP